MHKISLIVLLAATVLMSGCYTKAYVQQLKAQQAQSLQSNANQVAGQTNK
jgi:outer membrane murein-binding lipoprotein Lpp